MASRSFSSYAPANNDDAATLDEWLSRVNGRPLPTGPISDGSVDRILNSLDRLTRRIKGLSDEEADLDAAGPAETAAAASASAGEDRRGGHMGDSRAEASTELQRAIEQIARRRDALEQNGSRAQATPPAAEPGRPAAAPPQARAERVVDPERKDLRKSAEPAQPPARAESAPAGLRAESRRTADQPSESMARELRDLGARVDGLARSVSDGRAVAGLRDDLIALREAVETGLSSSPVKALEARYVEMVRRLDQMKTAVENPKALAEIQQQTAELRRIIASMPGESEWLKLMARVEQLGKTIEGLNTGDSLRTLESQIASVAKTISAYDQSRTIAVVENRLKDVTAQLASLERRLIDGGLDRLHDQANRQSAMLSQLTQTVDQLPRLAHEMERQSVAVDGVLQATEAVPRLVGDIAAVRKNLDETRSEGLRQQSTLLARIEDLADRVGRGFSTTDPAVADRLVEVLDRLEAFKGPLDEATARALESRFEALAETVVERLLSTPGFRGEGPQSEALAAQLQRIEARLERSVADEQFKSIEARLTAIDRTLDAVDRLGGPQLRELATEMSTLRHELAKTADRTTGGLEREIRLLTERMDGLPKGDASALSKVEFEVARIGDLLDRQDVVPGLEKALGRFERVLDEAMSDRVAANSGSARAVEDVAALKQELSLFQTDLRSAAAKDRELLLAIGETVQKLAHREVVRKDGDDAAGRREASSLQALQAAFDGINSPEEDPAEEAWNRIEKTLNSKPGAAARPAEKAKAPPVEVDAKGAVEPVKAADPKAADPKADVRAEPKLRADKPADGAGAPPKDKPRGKIEAEPSKADFIAAARRAAQAASVPAERSKAAKVEVPLDLRDEKSADAVVGPGETAEAAAAPKLGMFAGLMARRRQLAMAAAVVLIVFGASRIVTGLLPGDQPAETAEMPVITVPTTAEVSVPSEAPAPASVAVTPTVQVPDVSAAPDLAATDDAPLAAAGIGPMTGPPSGAGLPTADERLPVEGIAPALAETPAAATPLPDAVASEAVTPNASAPAVAAAPESVAETPATEQAAIDPALPATEVPLAAQPDAAAVAAAPVASLPEAVGPLPLREAAIAGNPNAQFEVAARYTEGRGIPQDLSQAVEWYRRAAESGLAAAQYRLGSLYEKGQGVPRDPKIAADWYQRAAATGNAKAMHNLAVLSAEGGLGEPDYRAAADWFEKAANYGVQDSQFNLGILYARGLGVERDLAASYKWFAIAAQGGDADAAKKRDDVAQVLDKDALARARLAVETWTAQEAPAIANEKVPLDPSWEAKPERTATIPTLDPIAQAQILLGRRGYDPGPVDGQMGKRTKDAIEAFQRAVGMPVTGTVDDALLQALARREI